MVSAERQLPVFMSADHFSPQKPALTADKRFFPLFVLSLPTSLRDNAL